jgi:hypothetical protein
VWSLNQRSTAPIRFVYILQVVYYTTIFQVENMNSRCVLGCCSIHGSLFRLESYTATALPAFVLEGIVETPSGMAVKEHIRAIYTSRMHFIELWVSMPPWWRTPCRERICSCCTARMVFTFLRNMHCTSKCRFVPANCESRVKHATHRAQ